MVSRVAGTFWSVYLPAIALYTHTYTITTDATTLKRDAIQETITGVNNITTKYTKMVISEHSTDEKCLLKSHVLGSIPLENLGQLSLSHRMEYDKNFSQRSQQEVFVCKK